MSFSENQTELLERLQKLLESNNKRLIKEELQQFAFSLYSSIKLNHDDISVELIEKFLLVLDKLYNMGEKTPLSDEEYDELHSIYIARTGKIISGFMANVDHIKVEHEYPDLKGTVDKAHYITRADKARDPGGVATHKVLMDWIMKTYHQLNPKVSHYLGMWPKYDGVSSQLSLDENCKVTQAITRGDKELGVGLDKTPIFEHYNFKNDIPERFHGKKLGLKVEAIMTKDHFKTYNKNYANNELVDERSAAVSLVNSGKFSEIHKKYLSVYPLLMYVDGKLTSFQILDDYWGPAFSVQFRRNEDEFPTEEFISEAIRKMKEYNDNLPVNCDGVIIRWIDQDAVDTLGRDHERSVNNFEIAYKFPKKSNYVKLIDIEQDIGLMGKVSFTAITEPFKFKKRTISRASLGSYDRMKTLNLAKGDVVNIKYEIIPYLKLDEYCEEHRSGNKPISVITHCPYCGEELVFNPELMCDNKECPSRVMGKIYNFCSKMNMAFIGEATIETLLILKIYLLSNKKRTKLYLLKDLVRRPSRI